MAVAPSHGPGRGAPSAVSRVARGRSATGVARFILEIARSPHAIRSSDPEGLRRRHIDEGSRRRDERVDRSRSARKAGRGDCGGGRLESPGRGGERRGHRGRRCRRSHRSRDEANRRRADSVGARPDGRRTRGSRSYRPASNSLGLACGRSPRHVGSEDSMPFATSARGARRESRPSGRECDARRRAGALARPDRE